MTDDPQNRAGTGRWLHGVSGNPGGRPIGFGGTIRRKTRDGAEMVNFALRVMRGKETCTRYTESGQAYEAGPNIKDRLDAMKWLADRGYGKALDLSAADPAARDTDMGLDLAAKLAALEVQ